MKKLRSWLMLSLLIPMFDCYAWRWQDLWATPDQQAAALMKEEQFSKAQGLFENEAWRASAAYRAKDYQQAAKNFESVTTEQGYYNLGNALAQLGKYEEAIKAYDRSLSINPHDQDAIYNRKLIKELLKQQQEQQQQKSNADKNNNKQQNKKNEQASAQQNQQSNSKENNSSEQQEPQSNKAEQNKSQTEQEANQNKAKNKEQSKTEPESTAEKEKQQAKQQWLRLIPDDPGGLLREKFLRDYIRRQQGWEQ